MHRNLFSPAVLISLLFLLAVSCEFELENPNFVELDQNPKSQLNLNNFGQEDTLLIFNETRISFNMKVHEGKFHMLKVFIDEREVFISHEERPYSTWF